MSDVPVTLKAVQPMRHVCNMAELMAGIFCNNIIPLVTPRASFCVDFSSKNSTSPFPCESDDHISRSINVSLKFSYKSRFGMAVDTIGNQAIQLIAVDDPKSGTVFHFKEDVLNGKPFPAACKRAETFLILTKLVAQTEGSVGFCHTRDIEILQMQGKGEAVKALSLKRDASSPPLAPVRPASGESSYPLMRPYYLYWNANVNSPLTREFVDFCNTN